MRPTVIFAALAVILLGILAFSAAHRTPEPTAPAAPPQATQELSPAPTATPARARIDYPAEYRDAYIRYAIIDRPDAITRNIYISPAGLDAARKGENFPYGTQFVVEAYNAALDAEGSPRLDADGHLIAGELRPEFHVAELRSDWKLSDLASGRRLGDFNFAAFDVNTGAHNGEFITDCFNCHANASPAGFIFTRRELLAYAQTGEVQYFYCNQTARVPCRF